MIQENLISRNIKKRVSRRNREEIKKKNKFKSIVFYIIFTVLFTIITAPFILVYGPFKNAKKTFIGTAMESMHYQWIATMFLSQDKINEILEINTEVEEVVEETEKQDSSFIDIPKRKDDTIELQELGDENKKLKGYALIIKDPTRVKIGVSSKLAERKGETVSEIAERYDAVAAINGGYFTDEEGAEKWTSNGGIPVKFLMSEGNIINDINHDEETLILAITKEGKMLVGETTVNELLEKKERQEDNVVEAMGYEVTLIKGGKKCNLKNCHVTGSAPRTLIGQREDGAIVMVVLNSDSDLPGERLCATMTECQKLMSDLGCYNAINLDGGKSTTMYLNGDIINNPSYSLGERQISSGFIVK